MTYDERLAKTVFRALLDNYARLGFEQDAYCELIDGLALNNTLLEEYRNAKNVSPQGRGA